MRLCGVEVCVEVVLPEIHFIVVLGAVEVVLGAVEVPVRRFTVSAVLSACGLRIVC
jgi:hypothetical protein